MLYPITQGPQQPGRARDYWGPMITRGVRLGLSAVVFGLSACASYGPAPLPDADSMLMADPLGMRLTPIAHARLAAAPVDLNGPLSDLDVGRIMLIASPDLAALRERVGVGQAQLLAAGILPDPQLSLSLDRPIGLGMVNAFGAGMAIDLASLLTRVPRQDAARSSLQQIRQDLGWSEWLAINQARTLVRRLGFLERQQALVDAAVEVARKILTVYRNNLQSGDARLDDVSLYQVAFIDAQDRSLALARSREAARLQLNALVGLLPSTVLELEPASDLHPLDALEVIDLARRGLRSRLDLQALRAGYAAQEANVRASVAVSLPLPQLALNRNRDFSSIWSSGVAATLSLPLWNRNRGDIAIAEATRAQLAAEYRARIRQMHADIAGLSADLAALDRERNALAAELPELRRAAQTLSTASRQGSVPLVTYETIRAALLDKELTFLALQQARAEGEIALEAAVGEFLWEPR